MKVIIHGTGVMAQLLRDAIKEHKDMEVSGFADELTKETGDIIIDFSHFSRLSNLLDFAKKSKIPLLIATTGYKEEDLEKMKEVSKSIPLLLSSNTSLGINLMIKILENITPYLYDSYDIEVIEKHHNRKIDAPSGTAKTLVETIEKCCDTKMIEVYGREGNKKREKHDIGIHAVRGGTVAGEHTVLYMGDDEILEIKHTALSRKIFVKGAIKAAEILIKKPIGFYTMKEII